MSGVEITGDLGGPGARRAVAKPARPAPEAAPLIVAELARAWNQGQPGAVAALFGEHADFIDILGGHVTGRAAIEAAHAAAFQGQLRSSRVEYVVERVKPLGERVAVVFLRAKLQGAFGEIWTRPTLTLRHGPDGWRIAVSQNTRIGGGLTTASAGDAAQVAIEAVEPKPGKRGRSPNTPAKT